jgi:hypothetical protein
LVFRGRRTSAVAESITQNKELTKRLPNGDLGSSR